MFHFVPDHLSPGLFWVFSSSQFQSVGALSLALHFTNMTITKQCLSSRNVQRTCPQRRLSHPTWAQWRLCDSAGQSQIMLSLRPGIIQEIGNMSSLATMDTMESRAADIIRDDLINDLLASTMSGRWGDVFVLTMLSSPFHEPSLRVPSWLERSSDVNDFKNRLEMLSEFIKFQFSRKPDFKMNSGLMESELERLTLRPDSVRIFKFYLKLAWHFA